MVGIFLVFVLGLYFGWPPFQEPRIFGDSEGYLSLSPCRPPVFSYIAHTLGATYSLCVFQFLLSFFSWSYLGFLLARGAGLVVFALFALSGPISNWNVMVLSESVSLSLLALYVSAIVILLRKWSTRRAIFCCLAMGAFGFTRVTNLYMLPFLSIPFFFYGWRRFAVMASGSAIVFMAGSHLAATQGAGMQYLTTTNAIMTRVLTEPGEMPFFRAHGMPSDERVMQFAGKYMNANVQALFKQSPEFEEWMKTMGPGIYRKWLLTRWASFPQAYQALIQYRNDMHSRYAKYSLHRASASRLRAVYTMLGVSPAIWLGIMVMACMAGHASREDNRLLLLLMGILPATYAQAFIGFHGDAIEVPRHLLTASVLYRLALLVSLAVIYNFIRGRFALRWSQHDGTKDSLEGDSGPTAKIPAG